MSDTPKAEILESEEYENCLDETSHPKEVNKPARLFGSAEDDEPEWKKHWKDMPDFKQDNNPTFKTLYLHFRNEDDYDAFAKLINQKLTMKTKSIWYPKLDKEANTLLRWIEDDE